MFATHLKITFFIVVGLIALVLVFYVNTVLAQQQEDIGVSITIEPVGGGGGGTPPPASGEIVLEGWAYSGAIVTVLRNGATIGNFLADNDGTFSRTFTNIPQGIHTLGIRAEDRAGRKSPTLNFTITVHSASRTTVSDILLPPTIESTPSAQKGGVIVIEGYSFPGSEIFLFIEPGSIVENTITDIGGLWRWELNTTDLIEGNYTVRAKSILSTGQQSEFSHTVRFNVLEVTCLPADFNCDGRVNLIDLSIMMFWWERQDSVADLNNDGIVNIIDFSILLYYWTG